MTAVTQVALAKLTPDPDQPRKAFDKVSLAVLAENIKARGVQQPLLVRKDGKKLIIKDGERRWRAAKLAKLKTVPVIEVKDTDTVQTRLDQVAVNNLREPLKPMDFARLISTLRKEHKLSDNEMAARLEKDGIPYQGKKHLADLAALIDLPDWAQKMIDAGEMDVTAAKPLIGAIDDKGILKDAGPEIQQRAEWGGKVTEREVVIALQDAYRESGPDLGNTESWHQNPVLFNPKTACKGCKDLRIVGSRMYCRNRPHFDELQAQAKEAGLLPGGKKPAKARAAEEEAGSADEQPERKEASRQEKVAAHLDAWLRGYIATIVLGEDPERFLYARSLADYMAAGMPDGPYGSTDGRVLRDELGRLRLTDYLARPISDAELIELARAGLQALRPHQVLELARFLKLDLGRIYRIDAGYLALKRKPELMAIAAVAGFEIPKSAKASEMPGLIMGDEEVLTRKGIAPERVQGLVERIGVPPDIQAAFDAAPPELDEGGEILDEMHCAVCDCTETDACADGCSWIRTDEDHGVGLCSSCDSFAERWDGGERDFHEEMDEEEEQEAA